MATFRTFLALAKVSDSAKDIVTAHLKLALCYHRRSDMDGTHGALRDARRAAEELKQPDLLAKAHFHLGEHFLNTSRPQYATTHLHQACELLSLSNKAEADSARALAGVAGGEAPNFASLVPTFSSPCTLGAQASSCGRRCSRRWGRAAPSSQTHSAAAASWT
ncbi:uncharacterized protein LOC113213450 [Frankliniella occidentalis]|uniref:Uncharacterized protein LOC113213450 n=1 Tax=Frankliniella occidentalis TaxID=133901 RepID=A0A9C6WVK5_FRAOC|nr:uncharacterized protein LOC113213450 [Frankliniella occidentalis]